MGFCFLQIFKIRAETGHVFGLVHSLYRLHWLPLNRMDYEGSQTKGIPRQIYSVRRWDVGILQSGGFGLGPSDASPETPHI